MFVKINEVSTRTVGLTAFHKKEMDEKVGWDPYSCSSENLRKYLCGSLRLRYDEIIVDDLVRSIGHICEVEIEDGCIKKVDSLMTYNELVVQLQEQDEAIRTLETERIDILNIESGKTKSKMDKQNLILQELSSHRGEPIHFDELADNLSDYMDRDDLRRLLGRMNTLVFMPRPDFWKRI